MYHRFSRAVLIAIASLALIAGAAHAQENGSAGLVIVTGAGETITRCVDLDQPTVSGERLLELSGLEVLSDPQSSMGATVCSIDGVGCDHPAEDCFCKCQGSPCTYWSYWRLGGEGTWLYSGMGAAGTKVTDGEVEGWVWGDGSSGEAPEPPAITFGDICAPGEAQATPAAIGEVFGMEDAAMAEPAESPSGTPAVDAAGATGWTRAVGIAVVIAIPLLVLVLQRVRRPQ